MPERLDDLLGRLTEADSLCAEASELCRRVQEDRMDAFSEILSGVKLNGAVFFSAEFSAPWGFSAPASNMLAATLAPGAAHLVLYHLVIEGGAVVELADGQSVELKPGDVVIFPHGDPHHMSSGKGRPAIPQLRDSLPRSSRAT